MKILSAQQLKELDKFTIEESYLSEEELIENAAKAFVIWYNNNISQIRNIKVFVGIGNNGADGLAIARILTQQGFKVEVYIALTNSKLSSEFSINKERLSGLNLAAITELNDAVSLPVVRDDDVVIDALFGSGLNRPVEGFAAEIIERINRSQALVISVDIPSGLFADKPSSGGVIKADYTVSFEFPKLAFFMRENEQFIGSWTIQPIGLDREYALKMETREYFLYRDELQKYLPSLKRKDFSHKGDFGHVLTIAGSHGKIGAAVLMNKATLTAGAGLVTAHIPDCGYQILQTAIPEVMVETDAEKNVVSHIPEFAKYSVIALGPGLGTNWRTAHAVKDVMANSKKPLVLDADALNIIAENPNYLKDIPKGAILTPHPKEFARLFGKSDNGFEELKLLKRKARELQIYIVLKGAYTKIADPEGNCYFNSTGNPGMATAGSGDVLTGIIAGLMAQLHDPLASALLGVYLHGLAGDFAKQKLGEQALTASDIIADLGKAFLTTIKPA